MFILTSGKLRRRSYTLSLHLHHFNTISMITQVRLLTFDSMGFLSCNSTCHKWSIKLNENEEKKIRTTFERWQSQNMYLCNKILLDGGVFEKCYGTQSFRSKSFCEIFAKEKNTIDWPSYAAALIAETHCPSFDLKFISEALRRSIYTWSFHCQTVLALYTQ